MRNTNHIGNLKNRQSLPGNKREVLKTFQLGEYVKKIVKYHCENILIFGNFGSKNVGDEAILAGQLEDLKKNNLEKITVAARFPSEVVRLHDVRAFNQTKMLLALKEIFLSDIVIFGGGGLICQNKRGMRGSIYQLYVLLLYVGFPLLIGKKVIVSGVGVYSDAPKMTLFVVRHLFNKVSIVTSRDSHSQALLTKFHIKSQLYLDNSYLMTFERGEQRLFRYKNTGKKIGIALKNPKNKEEKENLKLVLLDVILNNPQNTYIFFCLDEHESYLTDSFFAKSIIRLVKQKNQKISCFVVPKNFHPKNLFGEFFNLDFIIASRLHAQIFAHRAHVPFLGVTYGIKTDSFLKSVGKNPYTVKEISAPDISKMVKKI